jgi:KUP system potassium uptake protein
LRLGYLPHLRIRQTSEQSEGQIYVPVINWALFAAVLVVVFSFRSSAHLAGAYGVAVTGTFLVTTSLFIVLARAAWNWATWRLVVVGVAFGIPELAFFAANLTKVPHGGWFTLLIALVVLTVMLTWKRGRVLVTDRRIELEGRLADFLADLENAPVARVPGIAVFPHPTNETTPLALRANVALNHVLHQRVVIISGRTSSVPHVPWEQRLTVEMLGKPQDGVAHIQAVFGFQDQTDFPEVLRRATLAHPTLLAGSDVEIGQASYFLSRVTLRRTNRPGMAAWRKKLFITLAHNAASQAEFLCLPDDQTVVLSAEISV